LAFAERLVNLKRRLHLVDNALPTATTNRDAAQAWASLLLISRNIPLLEVAPE